MDYLADLPNLICSILELTTPNGGTASCRSAVFLWLGGGGERTLRGGKRTEMMGAGLGENVDGTLRRRGEDFEEG